MPGTSVIVGDESIIFADNMSFNGTERGGKMVSNGQLWIGSTISPHVRLGTIASSDSSVLISLGAGTIDLKAGLTTATSYVSDSGSAIPAANILNVLGQNAGAIPVMYTTASGSTVNFENRSWETQYVVDASSTAGLRGTFTTVQAAITAASSGQTVFIRPGTYTENLTLKAGVNLAAFEVDSRLPGVTILGTSTATFAGTASFSGICFSSNGSNAIAVTGASATILTFNDCNILANNADTAISYTAASASSLLTFLNCIGNITAGTATFYTMSSTGQIFFRNCSLNNTSNSSLASNNSAGSTNWMNTYAAFPISSSATGAIGGYGSVWVCGNNTSVTINGSTQSNFYFCQFTGGTASALSMGGGTTGNWDHCDFNSSNANAITGTGTFNYRFASFPSSTSGQNLINTTLTANSGIVAPINTDGTSGNNTIGAGNTATTVNIANGTGGNTISLANGVNTVAQIINLSNGATAADSTVNILSGVGTAGTNSLLMANNTRTTTIDIGNIVPFSGRTITIAGGDTPRNETVNIISGAPSANTQTISMLSGTATGGTQVLNLGTGIGGALTVNIGNGNNTTVQTVKISSGNPAANSVVQILNGDASTGTQTLALMNGTMSGGTQNLNIGNSIGGTLTISIGNGINSTARTINIGAGASAANNTINIGSGTNTSGVTAIILGSVGQTGNTLSLRAGATAGPSIVSGATTVATTTSIGGKWMGNGANTAPAAGFLGEEIRSAVAANGVASATTAVTNVTSIALSAGVWNIDGVVGFHSMTTTTVQKASISTTSSTLGTLGDNLTQSTFTSTTAGNISLVIPSWRLLTTGASTTVYLVASATYSVGTGSVYGRISAIRVG